MKEVSKLAGALTSMTGVLGRASNQIIALAITLTAARWLTPESFGDYAIAAALVTLGRTLLYAGAFEHLMKAAPGEEAWSECLAINAGMATFILVLLTCFSFGSTLVFKTDEIGRLMRMMAPSCLIAAGAAWQESQLLRSGRVKTYYSVSTIAEVLAAVAALILIVKGFGLLALVAQMYVRVACLLVIYRVIQVPIWSATFSFAEAWRVGRWSATRYSTTLINFLSNYSADLLLGIFLSPAATGLYRASHRMATGVSDLISHPTRMMAATLFSRRASQGLGSGAYWSPIAAAAAFLGWTALAGLAAISGQLVSLVLGGRWHGASPIIAILCLQRAFVLIDGVSNPMLVAYGKAHSILRVQVCSAIFGLISLAVVARFGVAAAAFSASLVAGASTVAFATLAAKTSPGVFRGLSRALPVALAPPAATGVTAFVVSHALSGSDWPTLWRVGLEIFAGVGAWALVTLTLRRGVMDALLALNPPNRASPVERAIEVAEEAVVTG